MLNLLDDSMEAFLRAEVPLPSRDVDVAFEAPDRDWGAAVTKPTLNLFLWDVRRNLADREFGMVLSEDDDGRRAWHQPKPRVDCRYLVTAWTAEPQDEHALLGAVLGALLRHHEVGAEHLQGAYAGVRPLPALSVAAADGRDQSDFWSALGGQLKPGLDVVVTATVDTSVDAAAGPPVERYEVWVEGRDGEPRSHVGYVAGRGEGEGAAGTVVRTPRGSDVVGEDGTFLVRAEPGDEVVFEREPPRRKKVPKKGHIKERGR